jgi:hypothetical protein
VRAIDLARETIADLREKKLRAEISLEHLEEIDLILTWALSRCEATPLLEPMSDQGMERRAEE